MGEKNILVREEAFRMTDEDLVDKIMNLMKTGYVARMGGK
jgi:hypothetical protein